jgi:flagellar protein FliL
MAEAQEHGEEPKSSKKKWIIIGIVLLLLLGGGGAGAYFYFTKVADDAKHAPKGKGKKGEQKEEKHEEAKAEESKHEEEKKDEHAEAEPDVYFDLPQPLLVSYPPGSSSKIIKISLTLLVKGESTIAVLKKNEPMLRNGLLMAISSIDADKAKTTEGKTELRQLLLAEVAKVLEKMSGKNTVKEVYYTEFVMQ